jgi:hypothetical protein
MDMFTESRKISGMSFRPRPGKVMMKNSSILGDLFTFPCRVIYGNLDGT